MDYTLFLDDERMPPDAMKGPVVIVRNVEDAKNMVVLLGLPTFISFDHDLGENQPTGHDFAKWLVDYDLSNNGGVFDIRLYKNGFQYYVHSQNPVGKANIEGLLEPYLDRAVERAQLRRSLRESYGLQSQALPI